jgi:hypothetical protein
VASIDIACWRRFASASLIPKLLLRPKLLLHSSFKLSIFILGLELRRLQAQFNMLIEKMFSVTAKISEAGYLN